MVDAKTAADELHAPTLENAIAALDPVVALRTLLHKYGHALEGTQHQVKEAFVAFNKPREPNAATRRGASEN